MDTMLRNNIPFIGYKVSAFTNDDLKLALITPLVNWTLVYIGPHTLCHPEFHGSRDYGKSTRLNASDFITLENEISIIHRLQNETLPKLLDDLDVLLLLVPENKVSERTRAQKVSLSLISDFFQIIFGLGNMKDYTEDDLWHHVYYVSLCVEILNAAPEGQGAFMCSYSANKDKACLMVTSKPWPTYACKTIGLEENDRKDGRKWREEMNDRRGNEFSHKGSPYRKKQIV
ncbi:unnamed protein product, partial [Brenthis ino]